MTRITSRSLLLTLLLLVLPAAGDSRRVGFAWLTIPVGPREAALAGAGTAVAFGPEGIFYNPAADAAADAAFSASTEYTRWFLDTHHQSIFIARNFSPFTLGLGIVSFANGKFEYREEIPTPEPLGTFSPLDLTGYLNLARAFTPWASAGISARYFYSKVMDYELSGWGFDLGARFVPVKNLEAGAALVNFCRTLSYKQDLIWPPARLRCGVGYTLPLGRNPLLLVADGSYFLYREKKFALSLGTQLELADILALRAGYDPLSPARSLTLGFGVRVKRLHFDYAFAPMGYGLGTVHRLGIGFGDGAPAHLPPGSAEESPAGTH